MRYSPLILVVLLGACGSTSAPESARVQVCLENDSLIEVVQDGQETQGGTGEAGGLLSFDVVPGDFTVLQDGTEISRGMLSNGGSITLGHESCPEPLS